MDVSLVVIAWREWERQQKVLASRRLPLQVRRAGRGVLTTVVAGVRHAGEHPPPPLSPFPPRVRALIAWIAERQREAWERASAADFWEDNKAA